MRQQLKNAPKDAALKTPKRLTEKQFSLLSHILLRNHEIKNNLSSNLKLDEPTIWSPKAFLERSPTKGELATLSGRIATLSKHGLIEKRGRYVKVTNDGKRLLRTYLLEHEGDDLELRRTRLMLDFAKSVDRLTTIKDTQDIAHEYGMSQLLAADKGMLPDLLGAEVRESKRLIKELLEITPPDE